MTLAKKLSSVLPREGQLLLLAVIVLTIPAWIKGINLLLLLACLLLAVWAVNWVVATRQLRRLRAVRHWDGPVFAGMETHWHIEVSNDGLLPSCGFRLSDEGAQHQCAWFVPRVEGRSSLAVRAAVTLPRRGRYTLEPVQAFCSYPFGLARSGRTVARGEECIVLPQLGHLNIAQFRRWLERVTRGDERRHRLARPSMLHQDDLHGLRPFRPGDNPRWIHWRTSARRNLKMVREFEEDTGQSLIMIFEPWGADASQVEPALEQAISLAATIAWEWCRHSTDYLMMAVAAPRPVVLAGHASRDSALDILRQLALVSASSSIDPAPLVQALATEPAPDAPVLLVSPRARSPLVPRLTDVWNRPVTVLTPERAAEFFEAASIRRRSNRFQEV